MKNGSIEYASDFINELGLESEQSEDVVEETQEMTFGLEKDMQMALRKNIQSIELGLEIMDGGKERHVEGGFIDITAKNSNGRIVIIELKAPTAKPM